MEGDVVESMFDGIEHSSLMLTFLTKKYALKISGEGPNGRSDNCYREFNAAISFQKDILVLVMEPDMLSTNQWPLKLRGLKGHDLYVDLSSEFIDDFDDRMDVLYKRVINILTSHSSFAKGTILRRSTSEEMKVCMLKYIYCR